VKKYQPVPKLRSELPPSLLPDREQQICARLRRVRQDHRFKQAEFADILGVPVFRLKSYEYARAPIKYGLAKQLTETMGVDPDWLATGTGEVYSRVTITKAIDFWIPSRLLFSTVYDRLLKDILEAERSISSTTGNRRRQARSTDDLPFPSGADQLATLQALSGVISESLHRYFKGRSQVEILNAIRQIERVVGPISKSGWATIKEALHTKKKRIEKHDLRNARDFVFKKLGLSDEAYRSLNVSEELQRREDQMVAGHKDLEKLRGYV
jgi:transcriptional regulator with XRE-family HTH domain